MKLSKRSNGVYYVTYRANGKTHKVSTRKTTRKEAEAMVKEAGIEKLEGVAQASGLTSEAVTRLTAGKKISLHEAIGKWVDWMRSTNKRDRTIECNYAWAMDFYSRLIGNPVVSAVNEDMIDKWLNDRNRKSGFSTRKSMLAAMRGLFEFMSIKGWVTGNPSKLVEVDQSSLSHKQMEAKSVQPFTVEEYKVLFDNTTGFWRFAVATSRHTGLRLGDICTMEWDSFDLPGLITVWTKKGRRKRVGHKVHPDIDKALEDVPLVDQTYLFPAERSDYLDPRKRSKFSVYFSRICKKNGIKGKAFHSLRHMFATELAKAGKSPEDIAVDMGHSNSAVTSGYIHE